VLRTQGERGSTAAANLPPIDALSDDQGIALQQETFVGRQRQNGSSSLLPLLAFVTAFEKAKK
jgi:hypothetical protein